MVIPRVIRCKHWGLQWGYDIGTDLPFGFTLCIWPRQPKSRMDSRFRVIIDFHFDWPKLIWRDRYWRLNEPGMIQNVPVARETPLTAMVGRNGRLQAITWRRHFEWVRFD